MTDSHIYELEDIVWDDFSVSDDHLVPHPEIQQIGGSAGQTESHKKLKHEASMIGSSGSQGVEHVGPAGDKLSSSYPNIKSDKVLVNGSWSHNPDDFQTYDDLMKNLSLKGTTVSSSDFILENNLYNGDPNPANKKSYSLSDAPRSGSDVLYLYNGHENNETDDPLFYEWPEIGKFDVDHMLRTCDSIFELGDSAKENEMCWFSSSTEISGSNANSKMQVRSSYSDSNSLKILSENFESPQSNYEIPAVDAFDKRRAGASHTSLTLASNATEHSCLSRAYSINELPIRSDKMDRDNLLKEVNMHIRTMDYQKQPMGTKFPLHHFNSSKPTSKAELSLSKSSQKLLSPHCRGLQKQNVVDVSYSDPVSVQKNLLNTGNEEKLNKNSQSSEISLEESSFLQLQEVMEKLDMRTKLRIRDSLYRLARSAEQRLGVKSTSRVGQAEPLIAGSEHAGLLDIETDTNPIDRSIAHLLFHRPNDPSKMLLSNTRPGHNLNDGVKNLNRANFRVAKKEE